VCVCARASESACVLLQFVTSLRYDKKLGVFDLIAFMLILHVSPAKIS